MKLTVLIISIVLPMLTSIGLYSYAFLSKRWSYLDEKFIEKQNSTLKSNQQQQTSNKNFHLEKRLIRHAFRSSYSLFGYCLDYKWLNLLTVKDTNDNFAMENRPSSFCPVCLSRSSSICPQTGCCMNLCNQIPDCPSYIDERNCSIGHDQRSYYWSEENCIWHSTWFDLKDLFTSLLASSEIETRKIHQEFSIDRLRTGIMFLLFMAAPMLTCLALLILLCINCIERFYSIPFAFVSLFCLASFLSGAGGLALFLYQWIHERFYQANTNYGYDENQAFNLAFNPWIIDAEHFGLAFWLIVGAISSSLFTSILSFCFCCGLQSEKSKLRIHVSNPKYEIVHMSAYDD